MNNFDLEHDQFWFFQDFEREHVDVRNFLFGEPMMPEFCLQQWVLRSRFVKYGRIGFFCGKKLQGCFAVFRFIMHVSFDS